MEFYGMTGEKLGTIGQVGDGDSKLSSLPRWKKELLGKQSILIRKGIAWGFTPTFEDTSTLMLTSTQSVFVDIRFPIKQDASGLSVTTHPAFWAFAGTSHTSFDPEASEISMPYSAHTVWKHEIDSNGPETSDEGDMILLPNGNCIEVGIMQNPGTGKPELYKEYWATPPVEPGESGGGLRKTPCVVARTVAVPAKEKEKEKQTTRGIIIRVGDYCQALARHGEHEGEQRLLVERWVITRPAERNPALDDNGGGGAVEWIKDGRSNTGEDNEGESLMPCVWACRDSRRLGDEVVARGVTWRIVEADR